MNMSSCVKGGTTGKNSKFLNKKTINFWVQDLSTDILNLPPIQMKPFGYPYLNFSQCDVLYQILQKLLQKLREGYHFAPFQTNIVFNTLSAISYLYLAISY